MKPLENSHLYKSLSYLALKLYGVAVTDEPSRMISFVQTDKGGRILFKLLLFLEAPYSYEREYSKLYFTFSPLCRAVDLVDVNDCP